MNWTVPSIGGIQCATAATTAGLSLILFATGSAGPAVGCAVGGAVMIANLFLLTLVGRWIVAAAGHSSGASRLGIIAAPLKLLFIVTVVALLLSRTRVNVPGLVIGFLTLPGAIFIETLRVSWRAS